MRNATATPEEKKAELKKNLKEQSCNVQLHDQFIKVLDEHFADDEEINTYWHNRIQVAHLQAGRELKSFLDSTIN